MTFNDLLFVRLFKGVLSHAQGLGAPRKSAEAASGSSENRRRPSRRSRSRHVRRSPGRHAIFESLSFGRAPLLSFVPRRHAALEALERRDLLTLTITGSQTAPEGASYSYTISVSNLPYPGEWVDYGTIDRQGELTDHSEINPTSFWVDAGASVQRTITVQSWPESGNDPPTPEYFELSVSDHSDQTVDTYGYLLDGPSQPRFCTCNCGCGVVEPSVDRFTGAALVGDGLGAAPGALSYNSYQRPHPLVDVTDTLSSTVANAANVETQMTLQDLSGKVVWTGSPVYYSPSGYTQGQQVEYADQIDATGLADGTYQWNMLVTENYSSGPAVTRQYAGFAGIENRDNSPYGSGWALHNVDRLVIQSGSLSSGASLDDGSGNVFFFQQNQNGIFVPPADSPQFASLVKNQDGTYSLTMLAGGVEQFSSTGLLTKSTDRDGNWLEYGYNGDTTLASVLDNVGRLTSFTYTGGHLSSVTDFAGRTTSYVFTGGQLTQITRPAPGDGEAQPVTTLGYDSTTGLLDAITDSDGTTNLSYNKWRTVTKIVGPDNTSTLYNTPASQAIVDTSSGVGTQANPAPLVYASSIVGTTTDGNNRQSQYTANLSSGDILSTTDASGNTVNEQTNGMHEVTQIMQPPLTVGGQNLVTVQKYNTSGDLI
ncbi:MAG: hypothetical protein ACREJM_00160, partial [Candidatus Saccharimonadales bacterium]